MTAIAVGWTNPAASMDNRAATAVVARAVGGESPGSLQTPTDDYSLARMLQAMEFEFDGSEYETEGERVEREMDGEFEQKEYRASKCKHQLTSLSTFICVVQVILFWAMCEEEGIAPDNPMYGPSALSLVKWGAKDASLILYVMR